MTSAHQKRASASIGGDPKNVLICLAIQVLWGYNTDNEISKGRAEGVTSTPRPYAGEGSSHTARILRPSHFTKAAWLSQGVKWECVFSFQRCRDFYTLRRFCLSRRPRAKPKGDGWCPTPEGRTVERILYIRRGFHVHEKIAIPAF